MDINSVKNRYGPSGYIKVDEVFIKILRCDAV